MLLGLLALGHIDSDANDPLRVPTAIVRNASALLDPPDLTVRANDAVLDIRLVSLIGEGLPNFFHALKILRVHSGLPLSECRLGSSFWQTVDSHITFRDLHLFRVNIIGVAAHERGPSCECELRMALGECLLCLPALCDIDDDTKHPLWVPIAIVRNEAASFDPPHSAAREKNAVIHTVLDLPLSEGLISTPFQHLN